MLQARERNEEERRGEERRGEKKGQLIGLILQNGIRKMHYSLRAQSTLFNMVDLWGSLPLTLVCKVQGWIHFPLYIQSLQNDFQMESLHSFNSVGLRMTSVREPREKRCLSDTNGQCLLRTSSTAAQKFLKGMRHVLSFARM